MIETDVQFSALKSYLNKAGLMDKLDDPGQWTLFAPTNKAFSNLDAVSTTFYRVSNKFSHTIDIAFVDKWFI